ncbi:MAG TPA: hypothetical protein VLE99_06450 [Candidatus Saccharimonadales bacterium]|nr:hypothetical protein [Candidatus Saccharimonadales bacterium]
MAHTTTEPTGWVGWVYFASMMMLILGGLQALSGLVALFSNTFYVTAHGLVVWNYHTWGWLNLIFGILVAVTGMAVAGGRTWARVVASIFVVLNAIEILAFLPAYPIWSIIALIISGFVIYALTVHGREVREDY